MTFVIQLNSNFFWGDADCCCHFVFCDDVIFILTEFDGELVGWQLELLSLLEEYWLQWYFCVS